MINPRRQGGLGRIPLDRNLAAASFDDGVEESFERNVPVPNLAAGMGAEPMTAKQLDDYVLQDQDDSIPLRFGGNTNVRDDQTSAAAANTRMNALNYLTSKDKRGSKQGASMMASEEVKGKAIMGLVVKLGNWGLNTHERLLKLNRKGLSYFRKLPPDYDPNTFTVERVERLGKEYLPKFCVPLNALEEVCEITQEERQKYKKFYVTEDKKE